MLSQLHEKAARAIDGKTILITGAVGSIGAALANRLVTYDPRAIRLLDHNEEEIFHFGMRYARYGSIRMLLGDVRDKERMKRAIQDVDVVFHCAALKHVGVGEYNPFEVVRTNLLALQNLIEVAIDADVERFIFTSSDKAVNPTNVMGGSKFIGERLVTAGNAYKGTSRAVFASTRFGNVLGSSGSVVQVFKKQIAAGGPLTVTDTGMTRFFMTPQEAVDLVLSALVATQGGEVFVPKMHAIRLTDLAHAMVKILSPDRPIPIEEVGPRPG
jgi:FlaA1/EpsC-like NDP-sugar epimerase